MALGSFSYSKKWTNSSDFPTYEASEAQVRADMQSLFDELKSYINTDLPGEIREIVDQVSTTGITSTAGELNALHEAGCTNASFVYLASLCNDDHSLATTRLDLSALQGLYNTGVTTTQLGKLAGLTTTGAQINALYENLGSVTATATEINQVAKASNNTLYARGLLDLVYPVGSYYTSSVSTSPATLFGGGTWEQITDRFILAAGSSYTAGTTGGVASVTLTSAQSGQKAISTTEGGTHTHTGTATGGDHTHTMSKDVYFKPDSYVAALSRGNDLRYDRSALSTAEGGSHTHDVSITLGGAHSHTIEGSDATTPHTNMPPYIVAYVWRRTA